MGKLGMVLVVSMFLLIGCQQTKQPVPTKYNGNYNTMDIRNLWMVCSVNWRQKNPFIDQILLWKVCDCYTDTIREVLSPEEIQGSDKIQKINLSKILSEKCNQILPPVNPT